MAMSTSSGSGSLENEINVVPMIDILLVLLIIFMAALPSMRRAIDIQLPDPNPVVQPANPQSNQIVLEVNPRVTTSYAGLRQALQCNPAELLVQLATGGWNAVTAPPLPREHVVRIDAGHF